MTERAVGSAAEEAVRLLQVLQERARGWADDEHLATGSPECLACPVCQAVGALRHVRPEAVEHLVDAASSLVAALKAAVVVPDPPAGERASRVQPIRLDDEPAEQDDDRPAAAVDEL